MARGVYKRTPDMKTGKHMLGRKLSLETRRKLSQNNSRHFLGKKLSEETKEKIRQANIGKKHSPSTRAKMSMSHIGRIVAPETRKKISDAQKGELGNGWRGGIYPSHLAIRKSPEYKAWRQRVFERDGFTCVNCGQLRGQIEADHIKPFSLYPELRFVISNGRTLCRKCHSKTPTYGFNIKWKNYEKVQI